MRKIRVNFIICYYIANLCFLSQSRLLKAMEPCVRKLSKDERVRNQHGPCQLYFYDRNSAHHLKSTLPGVFPDISSCRARYAVPKSFVLFTMITGYQRGVEVFCEIKPQQWQPAVFRLLCLILTEVY